MRKKKKPILTWEQIISALLLIFIMLGIKIFTTFFPNTKNTIQETNFLDESVKAYPTPVFYFDPNTADSLTLIQVGLQPWQVKNMMKYRAKGGKYHKPEDFKRLYGMTDSTFQRIKPYIRIDSTYWIARRDSLQALRYERDSLKKIKDSLWLDSVYGHKIRHEKKDTIIELNSTDTLNLQYIKGIGASAARQIIWYRNQLGGYTTPEQIREIKKISRCQIDSIIPHLTAEKDSVKPMKVNYYPVEKLYKHPYLTFTQAKAIYLLRRNKFYLNSIEDLRVLDCLTNEDIERLAPYLSFEK